ncbi:hypothetical protein [Cyanobium sp. NIES-981]|uniref:hypothetical protein n=1 Tax=Cyanobium sp. NIES-981 TaxID=1851505 RepID=UPI000B359B23|nr:hypothetical protein [Cyanobium sp. NIES-981]
MSESSLEQTPWEDIIHAHALESHDPAAWLQYGLALLQTLPDGDGVLRQQQQAALAFVKAQEHGATEEDVKQVQLKALRNTLTELVGLLAVDSTESR